MENGTAYHDDSKSGLLLRELCKYIYKIVKYRPVSMDGFGREYSMKCSTGTLGTFRAEIQDANNQHWSYCNKLVELAKENESDTLEPFLPLRIGSI